MGRAGHSAVGEADSPKHLMHEKRFGRWFGVEPQFWFNLPSAYDIRIAAEKVGREIARLPARARATRSDALGAAQGSTLAFSTELDA